jgi:hypothetical protein
VAQELDGCDIPGLVDAQDSGRSLDVGGLVAVLWQAVRELSAEVATLKGRAS